MGWSRLAARWGICASVGAEVGMAQVAQRRFKAGMVAAGVIAGTVSGCTSRPTSGWTPLADVNAPSSYAPAPASSSTMLYGSTRVVDAPSTRSDLGAMETPRTPASRPAPRSGDGAAPAVGLDSTGQVITSNDFRGKVVVLDFWATWCGPCKASSPAFQQLSERFAGDDRVMTLAIHTDHTGDPKAYMREHGYTFRMIPRGEEFAARFNVNVLPTFIILDARGREIYRDTGMMGDSQRAEVERLVRANLR